MTENAIGTLVVGAAIAVHRELGPGLLETVYEVTLAREPEERGLTVDRQVPIAITYKGIRFKVIVELKSVERVTAAHKKLVGWVEPGTAKPSIVELMKSVYIEASVISYLAVRPSRDLVIAAHQQVTHDWWQYRSEYELVISELVITEASRGNPSYASQRLALLEGVRRLALSEQARSFAMQLISAKLVPKSEIADALHIAVAATSGTDFLLTWNCAHIANATMRPKIEDWFRAHGITPPSNRVVPVDKLLILRYFQVS